MLKRSLEKARNSNVEHSTVKYFDLFKLTIAIKTVLPICYTESHPLSPWGVYLRTNWVSECRKFRICVRQGECKIAWYIHLWCHTRQWMFTWAIYSCDWEDVWIIAEDFSLPDLINGQPTTMAFLYQQLSIHHAQINLLLDYWAWDNAHRTIKNCKI